MASKPKQKDPATRREFDRSKLPGSLECLITKADICVALSIGERMLAEWRSRGQFPAPDLHLGKLPRWRSSTFNAWLEAFAESTKEG